MSYYRLYLVCQSLFLGDGLYPDFQSQNLQLKYISAGLATRAPVEPDSSPARNLTAKLVFSSFDIICLNGSYNPNRNVEYVDSLASDIVSPL